MDDDELNAFLGRGGTGVISFGMGSDEPPISLPVSYGYNVDETVFYYQLSFPQGTQKETLLDRPVSFVTYGRTERGWQSVIVSGQLEAVADFPYESSVIQGMWSIHIPRVDMFERPREEVDFRDFCLEPETMSGRKEVAARP